MLVKGATGRNGAITHQSRPWLYWWSPSWYNNLLTLMIQFRRFDRILIQFSVSGIRIWHKDQPPERTVCGVKQGVKLMMVDSAPIMRVILPNWNAVWWDASYINKVSSLCRVEWINGFSCLMCLFKLIFYEKYDWSNHSMIKCKFKKVNNWTTTTYAPMGAFDYTTNGVTMHAHSCRTPADKDQLIWINSWHSKTLSNMSQNSSI